MSYMEKIIKEYIDYTIEEIEASDDINKSAYIMMKLLLPIKVKTGITTDSLENIITKEEMDEAMEYVREQIVAREIMDTVTRVGEFVRNKNGEKYNE